MEGRKEEWKEGSMEEWKEGRTEVSKEGRKERSLLPSLHTTFIDGVCSGGGGGRADRAVH